LFRLPPLILMDPVTTTLWLISFGPIIVSILHRTTAYAVLNS
jgi:hypothetical protein